MSNFRPGIKILSEVTKTKKPLQQALFTARSLSLETSDSRHLARPQARSASFHSVESHHWIATLTTRNASSSVTSVTTQTAISKDIQQKNALRANDGSKTSPNKHSADEIQNVQDEMSTIELSQDSSKASEYEIGLGEKCEFENLEIPVDVSPQNSLLKDNSLKFVESISEPEPSCLNQFELARSLVTPTVQISPKADQDAIELPVDNVVLADQVASGEKQETTRDTSADNDAFKAFIQLETARLYIPPPPKDTLDPNPSELVDSKFKQPRDYNVKTTGSRISSTIKKNVPKEQQITQRKSFSTSSQQLLTPNTSSMTSSRGFATSSSLHISKRPDQSSSRSRTDCSKLRFQCVQDLGKNGGKSGGKKSSAGKSIAESACVQITFPGCGPRVRYKCEAPAQKRNCDLKVEAPCPSYSECIKDPTPPSFPTECGIDFKTKYLQPKFPIINSKDPFILPDPQVPLQIDPDLDYCCDPNPPPPFCPPLCTPPEDVVAERAVCVVPEEEKECRLVRLAKFLCGIFSSGPKSNPEVCVKEVVDDAEKKVLAIADKDELEHYPLDPTLESARPMAPHCKPKKKGTARTPDCVKIKLPFCDLPISTSCGPEVSIRAACQKPLAPMPSFSECLKDPFPRLPSSECSVASKLLRLLSDLQKRGIKLTTENITEARIKCLKPRCYSCDMAKEYPEFKKISHTCISYDAKIMPVDRSFTPLDIKIPEITCYVDKPKECIPRPPPPKPVCNPICEVKKDECDARPYRMPKCTPKTVLKTTVTADCKKPLTDEKKRECEIIGKTKSDCPPCFTGSAKKKNNKACDAADYECETVPYKTPKLDKKTDC